MANIPLKTIKFLGLDDTYTVPQIDSSFTGVAGEAPDSKKVHDEIDSLKEDLNAIGAPNVTWEIGSLGSSGQTVNYKNALRTSMFSAKSGDKVTINSGYCIRVFLYNSDGTFISRSAWTTSEYTYSGTYKSKIIVSDTTHKDQTSYELTDLSYADQLTFSFYLWSLKDRVTALSNVSLYVSPNGSDNNDGSYLYPLATINKALELGAERVLLFGGTYQQTIDCANSIHNVIDIARCEPTKKVTIIHPNAVIAEEGTAVSGYTKVYSCATNKTFSANNLWIYQDGIADALTLIGDAERMPQQRGQVYRCDDTKIVKCTSATLEAALEEIENSDSYKWFLDSGTLYYSAPQTVSSDHPLCGSFNAGFLSNTARKSLRMTGLEIKYMFINAYNTVSSVLSDCSVKNVFGDGCFRYNASVGIVFKKCEACNCLASSTTGDGFNAHSTNSDDAYAYQTTAILVDCWSHDNNDEGYSDHERCETTIIGGLYEHNGNAGLTPASGSHCTCYNVVSQNNGEGFNVLNTPNSAEGGVGSQCVCHNCVAINNERYGFRSQSATNKMLLFGCKSVGNPTAFRNSSDAEMVLYDCFASDYTTLKDGTVTVKNSAIVE